MNVSAAKTEHQNIVYRENSAKVLRESGTVFSAKVTVDDGRNKILQTDDDFAFSVDSSKISGDVGETLDFVVVKNSGNKFSIKQIHTKNSNDSTDFLSKSKDIIVAQNIREMLVQNKLIAPNPDDMSAFEAEKLRVAERLDFAKTLASIKRKIVDGEALNSGVIGKLISEGIYLEDMGVSTISTVVSEMKVAKNSKAYNQALEKLKSVENISDSSIVKLIKNNSNLTFENIYKAKNSDVETSKVEENSIDFEKITNFLSENDLVFSDFTESDAKIFINNEVDLTLENVLKFRMLKNIRDISKNPDLVVEFASFHDPNKFNFNDFEAKTQVVQTKMTYDEILKALPKVDFKAVDWLTFQNKEISLKNLVSVDNNELDKFEFIGENVHFNEKIALLEIQAKFTYECAQRLADKGIKVDVIPITDALEKIKSVERENFLNVFSRCNVEQTNSNLDKISDYFSKFARILPFTVLDAGKIVSEKAVDNVSKISDFLSFSKIKSQLEAFQTTPSVKYGDSINALKSDFSALLRNIGVTDSDENIRAAIALSKNHVDVSPENVRQIRNLYEKIEFLRDSASPRRIAELIGAGLDPVEMKLDNLVSVIEKSEIEEISFEAIAKSIHDMIKTDSVDSVFESKIVEFYQKLHSAVKAEGSNFPLSNGADDTLTGLYGKRKYLQQIRDFHSVLDFKVDVNFGKLLGLENTHNKLVDVGDTIVDVRHCANLVPEMLYLPISLLSTASSMRKSLGYETSFLGNVKDSTLISDIVVDNPANIDLDIIHNKFANNTEILDNSLEVGRFSKDLHPLFKYRECVKVLNNFQSNPNVNGFSVAIKKDLGVGNLNVYQFSTEHFDKKCVFFSLTMDDSTKVKIIAEFKEDGLEMAFESENHPQLEEDKAVLFKKLGASEIKPTQYINMFDDRFSLKGEKISKEFLCKFSNEVMEYICERI